MELPKTGVEGIGGRRTASWAASTATSARPVLVKTLWRVVVEQGEARG